MSMRYIHPLSEKAWTTQEGRLQALAELLMRRYEVKVLESSWFGDKFSDTYFFTAKIRTRKGRLFVQVVEETSWEEYTYEADAVERKVDVIFYVRALEGKRAVAITEESFLKMV